MNKKSLQIFLLLSLIFLSLNFISSSDSQLYQSCGGDAETTLGCLGDEELYFTSSASQVTQNSPTLTIIKPKNQIYFNINSVKVQIETNADNSWYNLDHGQNKTIQNLAHFSASNGVHTIYVYSNNSNGVTAKNVTFTLNDTKFKINHVEFTGSDKGESTNFSEYSYEEIQELSGLVFEKTGRGKIRFNQNINLVEDNNPTDGIVNLSENIIISYNRIEINSSALPNFNKSATLWLYGLTFSNPQSLMDGSPCPSSVCTEVSYSGGTLEFNVSHFTVFSARETPTASVSGGVIGGGNGRSECHSNLDCKTPGYGVCWKNECVQRLFDIIILDFESPLTLGDFFTFTYSLKDMANVDSDVNIDFWIEKEGEKISSGSEVIYIGGLQEITKTSKLFIPDTIESGIYTFYIQVSNSAEIATVHRTIQIEVDKESGTAEITSVPEPEPTNIIRKLFFIVIISFVILFLISRLKRRSRRDGLYTLMENIYGPYLRVRLKLKILRRRIKNYAERIRRKYRKPRHHHFHRKYKRR